MKYVLVIIATGVLSIPSVLWGAEEGFVPLIGIPGVGGEDLTTGLYLNRLYTLTITAAAFIAVVRIIIAGIKYALSEIATDKSTAKEDIKAGIIGLLIIIGAVTILQEVNPELTNFDALADLPTPVIQHFTVVEEEERGVDIKCEFDEEVVVAADKSVTCVAKEVVKPLEETPAVEDDFFAGTFTITRRMRTEMKTNDVLVRNGVTEANFIDTVHGVTQVSFLAVVEEGDINTYVRKNARPDCPSDKVTFSVNRSDSSYNIYCLK